MSDRVLVEEQQTDRPRTRLLKVTVAPEAVDEGLRRVARQVSRHLNIPGFRPGRAPYPLVEQRVGRTYLLQEFLEQEIHRLVQEALQKAEAEPGFSVELREVELEPPSFVIEVPLKPKVDLDDYLNVRVPYEPPEVTDEEVDTFIRENFLSSRVTVEEVSEPAQYGDEVDAIVTIRVGEETIEEETELAIDLDEGEEFYLPGLIAQVVGMAPGEEKTFTLEVPENHAWRRYGDRAEVHVRVARVRRPRWPELTPELVKELDPEAESPEAFREQVREALKQEKEAQYRQEYLEKVFEALKDRGVTVEYPPLVEERAIEEYLENVRRYAQDIGTTYEQLLQSLGKTEEELRREVAPRVREALWRSFVIGEILERHKPELKPEDLSRAAFHYVREHAIPVPVIERMLQESEQFREDFVQRAFIMRGEEILMAIARGEWQAEEAEAESTSEEGAAQEAEAASESEEGASAEAAEQPTASTEAAEQGADVSIGEETSGEEKEVTQP